ncbi:hypothetical protein CsSME_00051203 [Camellia sinensis var. sinensis]
MGHKIPVVGEVRNEEYYKFHNFWNHATNNCIIFKNAIQDRIDKRELKLPEKERPTMEVDDDYFLKEFGANMVAVNMVGIPRTTPKRKIIIETVSCPNGFLVLLTMEGSWTETSMMILIHEGRECLDELPGLRIIGINSKNSTIQS